MAFPHDARMSPATPLLAYRIGDGRFPLFDGRGAMLAGGRWNSPGLPVIYGALSQSCAMLEVLAHTNIGKLPQFHKMIIIEIDAAIQVEKIVAGQIPAWDHRNQIASRQYGDVWLRSQRSVALIVPSVIAKYDHNIVINPLHPDFSKIRTSKPEEMMWDLRLF